MLRKLQGVKRACLACRRDHPDHSSIKGKEEGREAEKGGRKGGKEEAVIENGSLREQ